MNGPLTIRRVRYQCPQTKQHRYVLDELLDVPAGEVTPSLARRALRLATHINFGPLQEELAVQHDVRLTDSTLDALMQKVGGVAEADRQALTDRLVSASAGVARETVLRVEELHPPERLYVGTDGVMYPTRYREDCAERPGEKKIVYQEMKTACVFWQDLDGKWIKRVVSGREDSERFGLSLWALAVRCGMLQAHEVIFISDGGTWCNTVAELYFADAVRILDFFHLSERVWQTAHAMYATDEAAAKAWASNCVGILKASSGMRLLAHLEKSRAVRAAQKDADLAALDGLIGYVKPRLHMTDYVEYAEAGYVIGSGMVEATCKQLVGVRLKGHGRQWSEPGAVSMAALIGQRLNGTWDRFWNTRPLQRAAA